MQYPEYIADGIDLMEATHKKVNISEAVIVDRSRFTIGAEYRIFVTKLRGSRKRPIRHLP